jgi:hypothetical protein
MKRNLFKVKSSFSLAGWKMLITQIYQFWGSLVYFRKFCSLPNFALKLSLTIWMSEDVLRERLAQGYSTLLPACLPAGLLLLQRDPHLHSNSNPNYNAIKGDITSTHIDGFPFSHDVYSVLLMKCGAG